MSPACAVQKLSLIIERRSIITNNVALFCQSIRDVLDDSTVKTTNSARKQLAFYWTLKNRR